MATVRPSLANLFQHDPHHTLEPMTTRRDFMKQGGAALGASLFAGSAIAGIPSLLSAAGPAPSSRAMETFYQQPAVKELMAAALAAAKAAGASYADARCS